MSTVDVTESHVRTAVDQGLDRTVVRCTDVSGLVSTTYVAECSDEDDVVVAFCHDPQFEGPFTLEPRVMDYVGDRTALPVAEPLYEDFSGHRLPCPFYIAERVSGYDPNLRYKYLSTADRRTLLWEVGEYLAHLHQRTPFREFGPLEVTEGIAVEGVADWQTMFHRVLRRQLDGMEGGPFEHVVQRIAEVVERHSQYLDRAFDPVLLHHDLRPANIIVEDGHVNAIVDWERAFAGHGEFDLFEAERNFVDVEFDSREVKEAMRDALFAGYLDEASLRDGWRTRRALYRLCYLAETMRFYPKIPDEKLDASRDEMLDELTARIETLERLASATVLHE